MSSNQIIIKLKEKLNNPSLEINERMSTTNCLIQLIRREDPNCEELYYLTKQFITSYIDGIAHRQFNGYDTINTKKLLDSAEHFDLTQRIALLKLAVRELKSNQYEDEAYEIELVVNQLELSWTWQKYGLRRPFKLLFHTTTYNMWTILCSLIIIPILTILILYPVESPIIHLFDISYENFSDSRLNNHLSNCLMKFIGMDGISIKPTGFVGAFIMFAGKVLFFVMVVNFFLDRISKYFNQ